MGNTVDKVKIEAPARADSFEAIFISFGSGAAAIID